MRFDALRALAEPSSARVLLFVLDGLGGLPGPSGMTELAAAATPNLDELARRGVCGLHEPVGPGITPGSGPAHLALFGYDPLRYEVGRGVLAALGTGCDLGPDTVAARGNFCTVDNEGKVADRRAGRIATELCAKLCEKLDGMDLGGVTARVTPVKEYRFLLRLEGQGLGANLADTDPQETGKRPLDPEALDEAAEPTANKVARFVEEARKRLGERDTANMVLLRGFSRKPDWPGLPDVYGVRAKAVAGYPMYRGAAALVGMDVVDNEGDFEAELAALEGVVAESDFVFLHFKKTDSAGEDGDFERKAALIEEADAHLPRIMNMGFDVVAVTGDHSTPAVMGSHSFHPVPLLVAGNNVRPDEVASFDETNCLAGGLGPRFPATGLMPLVMAHAGRLKKFGA